MVSFSWLHLTDLHLGMKEQVRFFPVIKDRFFEDLSRLREKCGPWDLVLFTGDLTQTGSVDDFKKVDNFLNKLWEHLRKLDSGEAYLLAVPGNHDLARPEPDPKKPRPPDVIVLSDWTAHPDVHSVFWDDQDSSYRKTVSTAFANYEAWWQRQPRRPPSIKPGILPGDFSAELEKSGASLGVVGLNSTFLQLHAGSYQEKLVIDPRQFTAVCEGDGPTWVKKHDACLLLTHQPPDWLTKESQNELKAEIAGYDYFASHLFGHMHEARYESSSRGGAARLRDCQASSLFGFDYFGDKQQRSHGYNAARIEVQGDKGNLVLWPRKAERPGEQWHFLGDTYFALIDERIQEEFPIIKEAGATPAEEPDPIISVRRPFPNQWAVMVGINDYQDANKLNYCRQDVIDLARAFHESLGFKNIFQFLDEGTKLKPERDSIFRHLVEIRGRVHHDDLFVFYFSGHGVNESGKDYLLPIGCPPRDVSTLGIRVEDLVGSLKKLACKNTVMFIDACREVIPAKGAGAGTASLGEESKTLLKDSDIIAFFSCDAKDRSFEIDQLKHGSFTYCLIQAIKDGAAETVSELDGYLKENVPQINAKFNKDTQQPFAVISPPERGAVEILFNPHWRLQAAQKFDPLIAKMIDLFDQGNGVLEQLEFLDQVKGKKQLDDAEKNKLSLVESLCRGGVSLEMFFKVWKGLSRVRPPQMKKG